MKQAGEDAAKVILLTEGMSKYPPLTKANAPPYPFYRRGIGTMYASGRIDKTSENLSKRWMTKSVGYGVEISNTATYAKWVHSDKFQARAMGRIGWRKLVEVAREKHREIQKVYQDAVNLVLRRIGLR